MNQFNLPTLLVAALVIAVVTLIVIAQIRDHRKGKSACSCGGDCSSCSHCSGTKL